MREDDEAARPTVAGGLDEIRRRGELCELVGAYLDECRRDNGGTGGRREGRIPNVAGFCRFAHVGVDEFDKLMKTDPEVHGALCAVFEDEAFNSSMSPSILSVYLKLRLGYNGESKQMHIADNGQLRLVFEHDAYTDGE